MLTDLFSAANLPMLLLFGSGILAISLLLLALTHWGHSRPIWKCVLLSFVAHILLMGYAYGTRLMWEQPTEIAETAEAEFEELQVTVIDDLGDDSTTQLETDQLVTTELPTAALEMPEVAPLMRPNLDSEVVVEMPEPSFAPTQPEASPTIELPAEQDADPIAELSPEEAVSMLPQGRIIDPEPIEVRRQRNAEEYNAPEVAFDGELGRPDFSGNDSSQLPMEGNSSSNDQMFAPANPDSLLSQRQLPQPKLIPDAVDLSSVQPIPRVQPATNGPMRILKRNRRIADGQPTPKIYSLRNPASRLRIARERGGSLETENAVDAALVWLAANQQENGSWNPRQTGAGREDRVFGHNRDGAGTKADSGITGLATLAFLAAGHSHLEGDYQPVVRKALEYLRSKQKSSGDLSGDARLFAKMYCHSMALLALSEALAMTGDRQLGNAVEKGVGYSEKAQNRTDGGWRYQPGDSGDMSQFGWQVMALRSAKLGGVKVSNKVMERMRTFLARCSSGVGNGLASYRPDQGPTTTMTAEALLCRYFLQPQVSAMTLMEAKRQISKERPTPKNINLYYWYYGTLAMYHAGGKDWQDWNRELKSTLLPLQVQDGEDRGSFPANGVWGGYGGRVYSTAMATLNLEVYYRYLPLYEELAESPATERFR